MSIFTSPNNLKNLFAIYLPLAIFTFILIMDKPFPDIFPGMTGSELGFTENLQALVLLAGIIVAAAILIKEKTLSLPLKAWIGVTFIGLTYIFLEEISYGQHYFSWNTPEYWQAINDQNETNFHNTSSWLDQKPRLLLEIGIIVGGLIIPLLRRLRPSTLPQKFQPIYPDSILFVVALLAILPRLYDRIISKTGIDLPQIFTRTSEIQELYFYYFVLLYLVFFAFKNAPSALRRPT